MCLSGTHAFVMVSGIWVKGAIFYAWSFLV